MKGRLIIVEVEVPLILYLPMQVDWESLSDVPVNLKDEFSTSEVFTVRASIIVVTVMAGRVKAQSSV